MVKLLFYPYKAQSYKPKPIPLRMGREPAKALEVLVRAQALYEQDTNKTAQTDIDQAVITELGSLLRIPDEYLAQAQRDLSIPAAVQRRQLQSINAEPTDAAIISDFYTIIHIYNTTITDTLQQAHPAQRVWVNTQDYPHEGTSFTVHTDFTIVTPRKWYQLDDCNKLASLAYTLKWGEERLLELTCTSPQFLFHCEKDLARLAKEIPELKVTAKHSYAIPR
jgi:hypothetical protein